MGGIYREEFIDIANSTDNMYIYLQDGYEKVWRNHLQVEPAQLEMVLLPQLLFLSQGHPLTYKFMCIQFQLKDNQTWNLKLSF